MKPKGGRNCDKMTSLSLNCDVTLGAPEISSVGEREGGGGEGGRLTTHRRKASSSGNEEPGMTCH